MNGFANAILSLLLGWLRTVINNLWRMLNSENGGAMYQFMASHWMTMVIVLCVAGFVIDRVVYLIRWRPYYVWSSKLGRLRRRPKTEQELEEEPWPEEDVDQPPYVEPPYVEPPTQAYRPPVYQAPVEQPTRVAVPVYAQPQVQPTQAYAPPYAAEPWQPSPASSQALKHDPSKGMAQSFGNAQPEPLAYLRDMQAGFAPPKPPEELYAQPQQEAARAPVHPGLDNDAFRHSFGLEPNESADDMYWDDGEEEWDNSWQEVQGTTGPVFMPYAQEDEQANERRTRRNPFAAIAQKARDLVGVEDEDHRPTIHDLHSTVDMRDAFHRPVFPKRNKENDE